MVVVRIQHHRGIVRGLYRQYSVGMYTACQIDYIHYV
jgi:hypothetical protein